MRGRWALGRCGGESRQGMEPVPLDNVMAMEAGAEDRKGQETRLGRT